MKKTIPAFLQFKIRSQSKHDNSSKRYRQLQWKQKGESGTGWDKAGV